MMREPAILIEEIATALGGRSKSGGGYMCRCPAHDDLNPSLSIDPGVNGAPVLKCFSGCSQNAVIHALKALGLWHDGSGRTLSEVEVEQARKRTEERKAEEMAKHDKAAILARSLWRAAKAVKPDHPYLLRKQVQPTAGTMAELPLNTIIELAGYHPQMNGAPLKKGRILIIPVKVDDMISTIEFIDEDGRKTALKNGKKKDGYWYTEKLPEDDGTGLRLLIGEGVATCLSAKKATGLHTIAALTCGNIPSVAKQIRERYPKSEITILADLMKGSGAPDPHAVQAAAEIGGKLAVPDFGPDRPEKMTDFNDLAAMIELEAVKACIEKALVADKTQRCGCVAEEQICEGPEIKGCGVVADSFPLESNSIFQTVEEAILKLAGLSPLEYDKVRKEVSKNLGVRATVLDEEVKKARNGCRIDTNFPFKNVELWPNPINPAEILSEITTVIRRFIVCDREVSTAVALWVAMTWFMEIVQVAPLAVITAPEKRCGKSQLLSILGRLVCRPITASNISPAALFRAIDAWKPTLLIDEVDACMKDNEELRGIINSGHTRDSAYVIRTVGDNHTPTTFSTWGAKALSGIGHVADTLMDRAIVLELRRKLSHESVDRLRHAEPELFEALAAKLARFAYDYSEQVRQARPYLPPSLNDRAQDNWEPLLAIALVAGPEWMELATKTALKLSGGESVTQSTGTELLGDIQEVFESKGVDRISTTDLIKALVEDDEKPWATYYRGLPIKPRQLASRLKGYGIVSKSVRIGPISTPKGYEKKQFEESFSRYLYPPEISATTPQVNNDKVLSVADMNLVSATDTIVTDNFEVF